MEWYELAVVMIVCAGLTEGLRIKFTRAFKNNNSMLFGSWVISFAICAIVGSIIDYSNEFDGWMIGASLAGWAMSPILYPIVQRWVKTQKGDNV